MTSLSRCENLLTGMADALRELIDSLDAGMDTEDAVEQGRHMLRVYINHIDEDED